MKIIISPSKTQSNLVKRDNLESPKFYTYTKKIIKEIRTYKKNELSQIMHLNGKLLDEVYLNYKHFKVNTKELTPAIQLYSGVVYDSLNIDQYNEEQLEYLNNHVRIISAMHGVLKPMDGVQTYRLDFTMKLNEINLNTFWKEKILAYFRKEDLILDCASLEFSHFLNPLKRKVHRVEFIDVIDGQEKIISYNAKKLRGLIVDYCIRNQVISIEQIREFSQEGYTYQSIKSNSSISVFVRYNSTLE